MLTATEILRQRMKPQSDYDSELMRRIAAGEEAALNELVALYGQRLFAYAIRLTGEPATAEDVLQESLIAVWQGAERYRGEGRLIAWLLGIVHHKAFSQLRWAARRQTDTLDSEHEIAASAPGPDDLVERGERAHLVQSGLASLSIEHRLILELVFYQGLTLKETADICNCPIGTIKSRLNYAKNRLKGLLHRQGLDVEDVA
jgi:RNA polymerase sigma-70 factor (ECF subfamily)